MNHSRIKLVIIFAMFLGPLLAAFVWYYGFGGAFAPRAGANHASLIAPLIPLHAFSNTTMDGAPFTIQSLKHRWSIIHRLPAQCARPCEKSLYNTRQTRLAMGKDANRIQRIVLSPNQALLNRIQNDHPDAIRLEQSAADSSSDAHRLENQLAPLIQRHNIGVHDALLVDPLGNLMMIIPADLAPGLLLKDLKRLLKFSRIG